MRKLTLGIIIAMVAMTMMAGVAAAQHTWSLISTGGAPLSSTFDLVYTDPGFGTAWNTDGYTLFVEYSGGNSVAGFTIELPSSGNPVPDAGSMDLGAGGGGMMFSTWALSGSGWYNSGSTFATLTLTNPGTVAWWYDAFGGGAFMINDPPGNAIDGQILEAAGQLVPGDSDGPPGPGDPAPPIPEIITIVLISIGLVALGGYIWYRRQKQEAVTAA